MRSRSRTDTFSQLARSSRARPARASAHWIAWIAVPLALALTGCGHPATRDECNELFAKSAEIELRGQNITDRKTIDERTATARATPKGGEFTGQCVGKRITDRALKCVRSATTAEQFDRCL
jgi:hypothetical protein